MRPRRVLSLGLVFGLGGAGYWPEVGRVRALGAFRPPCCYVRPADPSIGREHHD